MSSFHIDFKKKKKQIACFELICFVEASVEFSGCLVILGVFKQVNTPIATLYYLDSLCDKCIDQHRGVERYVWMW